MEKRKLCPMSMSQTGRAPSNCQKECCAWYINGDCAINHLAQVDSHSKPEESALVYCKNCKYSVLKDLFGNLRRCCELENLQQFVNEDHFCGYGEPKE